jgi:hypothetical protein
LISTSVNVVIENPPPVPDRMVQEGVKRVVKRRRPLPDLTQSNAVCKRAESPLTLPAPKTPQTPTSPPPSPPLPPLPFRNPKPDVPSTRRQTPTMPLPRAPIQIRNTCGLVSSYTRCTLCYEPHAHPHTSPRRQSDIVNIESSCLERTHVKEPKLVIQPTHLFDTCSTAVAAPPPSHSIKALPRKQKHVYSKWASRKSDHKVVLKLSPKITTSRTQARHGLPPNIAPTHKPETPSLPTPLHKYRTEMNVSIEIDASKVMMDVEDKNKVFK